MPISKQVFAAAVAHGIDPRAMVTWHPDLPRTPRVLVPIQVDALVVRTVGGVWADCGMRDPDPENEVLIDAGIEPTIDSNPEHFRQSLAADVALWAPVVKSLALKID